MLCYNEFDCKRSIIVLSSLNKPVHWFTLSYFIFYLLSVLAINLIIRSLFWLCFQYCSCLSLSVNTYAFHHCISQIRFVFNVYQSITVSNRSFIFLVCLSFHLSSPTLYLLKFPKRLWLIKIVPQNIPLVHILNCSNFVCLEINVILK